MQQIEASEDAGCKQEWKNKLNAETEQIRSEGYSKVAGRQKIIDLKLHEISDIEKKMKDLCHQKIPVDSTLIRAYTRQKKRLEAFGKDSRPLILEHFIPQIKDLEEWQNQSSSQIQAEAEQQYQFSPQFPEEKEFQNQSLPQISPQTNWQSQYCQPIKDRAECQSQSKLPVKDKTEWQSPSNIYLADDDLRLEDALTDLNIKDPYGSRDTKAKSLMDPDIRSNTPTNRRAMSLQHAPSYADSGYRYEDSYVDGWYQFGSDTGNPLSDRFRSSEKKPTPAPPVPAIPYKESKRMSKSAEIQSHFVSVIIDRDTAHPNLEVSDDGKSVYCGMKAKPVPKSPARFDKINSVVGMPCFGRGKQYWEVNVENKARWVLGVCKISARRNGDVKACPANGYWVIMRRNEGLFETRVVYEAWEDKKKVIPMDILPYKIGIYLNCDSGELSFYNANDPNNLVKFFTFWGTFIDVVPFFDPCWHDKGGNMCPLRIVPGP
ncbi:uncharacterized protein LOC122812859 [Protopterus annectens]|uniref:uncharacterized protein LOC122812859 n=1 Tax=Protopterus annectens TaxID=7888 RepID=UPI001CFB8CD6|nr:uncharacterized protein LOC122812859 [Protopterus annectens]